MKRAVEFAADVAEGGPVVVHAGEYPREVHEVKGEEGKLFKAFPGAEKETVHYLIDQRQGKIVSTVREDQKNFVPVIKGTNKSVWDEDLRELERDMRSGNIKIVEKKWDEYLKQSNNNSDEASKAFFRDTLSRQKMQAVGQANQFEITNHEQREKAEKLQASLKWWEKNEPHLTDAGRKMYMHKDPILSEYYVKQDEYTPTEWLKKQLWEIQKSISYGQETAAAARTQIAELEDMEKNTKPLGEFAVEKSADSIAELGIYAMKQEKMKGLGKPIFIAPENIFPEQYGGHPQELKELIIKSRERMVERLVNEQKVSKSVAEKAAAEHIKATFDIGHANTWRRYFQGDPKDFDKWLLKQVDDLQRSGVIGHIHMTDNFGYVDEHVTPGQGNVPVEKFMEHLKKSGYQGKIIIEPSHQDYQSWLGALKASQSPIYRIDGASKTWTDIESGYFGQTRSPRYIFGPYAPDEKAWSMWNEIPLE
jgi:hypothetical protein